MIIKIVIGSLLALSAVNAVAGEVTFVDKNGDVYTRHITDTIEEFYGNDKRAMLVAEDQRSGARLATAYLHNFQTNRRMKSLVPKKSETVFRNGNNIDVGAKMGMTPNQVLTKTHWGKPEYTNVTTDELGKLEQWIYGDYVNYLTFDNDKLISINQSIIYMD